MYDFFGGVAGGAGKYTVPEGVLDEDGQIDAFNNNLVIRYLDKVIVKEDDYEVAFKAGVTVEVEV